MPRVRDSREPELSPPRQYSGDDGLRPADCKDPWQLISALLGRVTWYPPFGVELSHHNSSRALARRHPFDKNFCIKKFDQSFWLQGRTRVRRLNSPAASPSAPGPSRENPKNAFPRIRPWARLGSLVPKHRHCRQRCSVEPISQLTSVSAFSRGAV